MTRTVAVDSALKEAPASTGVVRGRPLPLQRSLQIGRTDDPLEHEADRVAREVLRAPGGTLRRCACGGSPGPSGECAACKAKRLGLQRAPASALPQTVAPAVVHEVIGSQGRPLDARSRTFFEPRLGEDLSDVRIHDDATAARSAEAVGAIAYTVGNEIAFAAGRHAPGTNDGDRLLAHELAHVVQQAPVLRRETPPAGGAPPAPAVVPPAPAAPAPTFVCGPDVTKQVTDVLADVRGEWSGWTANQRDEVCWALQHEACGPGAWDIFELHNNEWILDYRPACASAGADPRCGSSVEVDSACHYAGSVNYVVFGAMCQLCGKFKTTMQLIIRAYKTGFSGTAANLDAATAWAEAGYAGWPGAATPPGDRTNCAPTCPAAYGPTANNPATKFEFFWYPVHSPLSQSGPCKSALDLKRSGELQRPPPVRQPPF